VTVPAAVVLSDSLMVLVKDFGGKDFSSAQELLKLSSAYSIEFSPIEYAADKAILLRGPRSTPGFPHSRGTDRLSNAPASPSCNSAHNACSRWASRTPPLAAEGALTNASMPRHSGSQLQKE